MCFQGVFARGTPVESCGVKSLSPVVRNTPGTSKPLTTTFPCSLFFLSASAIAACEQTIARTPLLGLSGSA